ncbi:MAG TPA: glutamine-hydrolyzing carbamoyl-phosphate synthase small subunit [Acidimicrobiales bacterium]|nr:glutamine-hydrolyzing carbamoyl-phosphate synthase small subunit [Acidimicrobiales bacterium]
MSSAPNVGRRPAHLVTSDGSVFEGEAAGALIDGVTVASGEVVFNTVMSGYQEVMTDPSYAGQVITFTYPHIGNYGVAHHDDESRRPFCRGVIARDLAERPSSWRASESVEAFLRRHGIPAMSGVDTRRLTRLVRESGSMPCAFGTAPLDELRAAAQREPGTEGLDLVATVTTERPYRSGHGPLRVVAYDFGIKRTILECLGTIATVDVVPASTPAEDVLASRPDGVFLSTGPGDPAAVGYAADSISELLGRVPMFGICLGHQLMAVALGAKTYKLPFGHHGGNHPVRNLDGGPVEITSQNHNYAVAAETLPSGPDGAEVTHINLNDGVVEGLRCRNLPAFSVQYHPEAGPGPHDARYLFERFRELMTEGVLS